MPCLWTGTFPKPRIGMVLERHLIKGHSLKKNHEEQPWGTKFWDFSKQEYWSREGLPIQIVEISDNKRMKAVSFIQSPPQASTEMPER